MSYFLNLGVKSSLIYICTPLILLRYVSYAKVTYMKLGVLRDRLYRGCLLTSKIVTSRSNLPILSNIIFTATEDNALSITASNLDISIRLTIPAKVEEPGQTSVPAKKFTEYLASLQAERVDLSNDRRHIVISDGNTEARFVTMPADDFPVLPEIPVDTKKIIMHKDGLHQVIRQVIFASATGEMHPVLSGVLFEGEVGGGLTVVATDSFRLSKTVITNSPQAEIGNFILPANVLSEVDHIAQDAFVNTGDSKIEQIVLSLSPNENQVFFSIGAVEVIARLLEAEFPDYRKVIPSQSATTVKVDREALAKAIRRSAIFTARDVQAIRCLVSAKDQTIKVQAQSAEVGSVVDTVPAQVVGDDLELGFNYRYLADGLDAFIGQTIKLSLNQPDAPVLLSSDEVSGFVHVIMPMSLNNDHA